MPRIRHTPLPPLDVVRQHYSYDAETGRVANADGTTGYRVNGYIRVKTPWGELMGVHQIAWALYHGEWASQQIDHINCIRDDNRICNLRLVTPAQNAQNRRKANSTNTVGLLGVNKRWRGASYRYEARIRAHGVDYRLGWFASAEEAHAAYMAAKARLHDGFASVAQPVAA